MDLKELKYRQSWTLEQKIDHTLGAIDTFVNRVGGLDKVYIGFSGGKDSTVLSHLARKLYPNILHVFVNTGNEYPEILKFVSKCEEEGINLMRIRPKMTPRQVWAKYGFPLVSKETAENVDCIRKNPNSVKSKKALGILNPNSMFVLRDKYRYLIDEPYHTSKMCCDKLKKEPSHRISKEMGLSPILGTMASESLLREKTYIRRGGVTYLVTMVYLRLYLCLFGLKKIFGSTLKSTTLKLQRFTTRVQRELAVLDVVLVANSQMILVSSCCTSYTRNTTTWL